MNRARRHLPLFVRAGTGLAVAAAVLLLTFRFSSANSDPVLSRNLRLAKAEQVAALMPAAEERGELRIIVRLNVPFRPEGELAGAFQAHTQRDGIAAAQRKLGGQFFSAQSAVVRNFKHLPLSVLSVSRSDLEALASNPLVMSLQEDVPDPPALDGSIPLIGADTAWSSGYTGSGQHVAILDTGVDSSHEFLTGKVVAEACFSTTDAGSTSSTLCPGTGESEIGAGAAVNCSTAITGCDHGTHVAGIAAGTGASFSGVAKGADIIAVQVFSRFDSDSYCGAGNSPCILSWTSDQIAGLDWIYSQSGTFAIAAANMSLGGGTYSSNCDSDIRKTSVDQLRSVGIATVISSGNSSYTSAMSAPACVSTAISVGSTTSSDTVSSFSNIASFISLLAPGSSINSSIPGDLYASKSGTSMSAPHVTGAWAVLKSKDPGASVDAVLSALTINGISINDTRSGGTVAGMPRIQVDTALAALPTPTSTPEPTQTFTPSASETPTPLPSATPTLTLSPTPTSTSPQTPTPASTAIPTATATPGCDPGFGTNGIVTTSIGVNSDYGQAIALQPDGKIVVAGYSGTSSARDFAVARYNPDGSLDISFDGDGKLLTAVGTGIDQANDVALQPDGKIVVVGTSWNGSDYDFAVVRYNPDGSLDTSFDVDGMLTTNIGSWTDRAEAVVLQSDGKIVATGVFSNGGAWHIAVARYNSNGSLDTSFGSGGIATTIISSGHDFAYSIALQSDGKVVVGGHSGGDFFVVRYSANGNLDNSFGSGGVVTTSVSTSARSYDIAIQSDGKIVVAGYANDVPDLDFAVLRYDSNGNLDPSFDGDGKAVIPIGIERDIAFSVAIQPDGKIVLAGATDTTDAGISYEFAVVRINADGSLDPSFNGDGIAITPYGNGDDRGQAVAIQSDGKIVVAGYVQNGAWEFGVFRFLADGSLDVGTCAPTPTPTALATDAPTPTVTPALTPTPTNTPLPTSTPSPIPTNTPLPTATATSPADLNLDGTVDVLDVQLCVNVFLGTETDPGIVSRSDVNSDSAVDVLDVQLVVNDFLGG